MRCMFENVDFKILDNFEESYLKIIIPTLRFLQFQPQESAISGGYKFYILYVREIDISENRK